MRLSAVFPVLFLAAAAFAQTTSPAAGPAAPPAYEANPAFTKALADAAQDKRQRQYEFAIDAYRKANKIAQGQCSKCLRDAYELQMGLGKFKDAALTATDLITLADSPSLKSMAESEKAQAMLKQAGDKPKPEQLEAIHILLTSALADAPKNLPARYTDACVLARLGKDNESGKQFTACAEAAKPTDPMRIRAQHFAADPKLSLQKMAPAFEVTALDGSRFNLDSMGGKVVLIDFWATWCGPCNEELPHIKKIAKEFAGQPLVILSISWDDDEAKWKAFLNKNEMTWLQFRDADHKLSERFGVQAIPHYFTIDSDGVLTAEMLGSGSDVEGKLKKLIKRANDAKAQTVASN